MSEPERITLPALLGDYPVTAALRRGELRSASVAFDFAQVKTASAAFKRVVRDLEFDVAELAIVTFLVARAHGKPLVLLPAVLVGRFQHPYIVYDAERGPLAPGDLAGRRVGMRSYSVTTATWVRDPPNLERAPAGKDLVGMLLAGELDAAIVGEIPTDPRLAPLIPDPAAAAQAWQAKHGALQINHMVVVKESLSRANPRAVREIYRLLAASKTAAGSPPRGELDTTPFGLAANRRNLEVAIDYVYRQRLIPRRFAVDELFDDVTRALGQ